MFPSGSIGRSGADNAASTMPTPNSPSKGSSPPGRTKFITAKKLSKKLEKEQILTALSQNIQLAAIIQPSCEQKPDKIRKLVDIQAKVAAGKGIGYERWAKKFNLKRWSQTLILLQEKGLTSEDALHQRIAELQTQHDDALAVVKDLDARMVSLKELRGHLVVYRQYKPLAQKLQTVRNPAKFKEQHRAEFAVYEAACAYFKANGLRTLPDLKKLDAEYQTLSSEKNGFYTRYKKAQLELRELRTETYPPEWKPQLDRIHLQNGTYFLDERGFVPEKELCLNRLPVEYQPDAPAPTKWLEFLDGLLIPEDILTLQEYLGYLLIPSTKAQKMLVMTGKGGEGKSRIGLLLKKLFGEASHCEASLRIETNRFASANLEYKLVMVDDDRNMVALPETRNIKSIVTAEDRLCIERKNKQAVQGLLYVRFICFGNGNLVAAHDDSDGFWRRQILITVKDRDPARVDNPFLIEELSEERPGILLWMLEGLHRLLANRYQFTISERSIQNLEAAMADSDNLTQFMQATAYVRFKPDTEERSTYLYRAYTKWCEDNLESPVPQKKFSQFLLKNAGKYGLTFSKHIEGKYRGFRGVCVHPAFAAA